MGNIDLVAIFLTGLLTGGFMCMAVQGGLLATTLAQREEELLKEKATKGQAFPILAFLVSKLVAYTLLGFLLGWFGSLFQLSIQARIVMQIAVAVFMIGTALNILEVHPVFRYFIIQPPKFLTRMLRKKSKSKDFFTPAILGAFTIFIPCGTTQAMMALAIGSGNPILGASVLFSFILGTSPLFFVLGYFATKLGERFHQNFMRVAAISILLLAVFNINNAVALTGSAYTLENLWNPQYSSAEASASAPETNPTLKITSSGYDPSDITVKAGSKVSLKIKNTDGQGCIQAFTIPSLGIQKVIQVGSSETISFTAPQEKGDITFMCSMGMYRGVIHVI